jgi:uncharacterized protein (TIGR00296 family)
MRADKMVTILEGKIAIRMARNNIERYLGAEDVPILEPPESFNQRSGVFVTLNTYPEKDLRGCIGFPEPVLPLKDAIIEASISAATRDPRFPKVRPDEMDRIIVEVTLLSPPEDIEYSSVEELKSSIVIGKHGLIAKRSFYSGLLLPQVPVEWKWDVEEFLSHTCMKAGLSANEWRKGDVKFKRFSGQVFGEKKPRGDVEEIPL